jgi:anti-sigma regulatory factor (Ser/Thr protein kinase)
LTASKSFPGELNVVLHITSDTANLAGLRDAVTGAATQVGFGEPAVSQIVLAADEAIGNVIKHGYDGRPGEPIDVAIETIRRGERRGLQITVCDCGRQVAPEKIVGRKLEDVRPGGLGTHIIRNVMDEVEYSLGVPQGMRLRMAKLLGTDQHGQESTTGSREGSANEQ